WPSSSAAASGQPPAGPSSLRVTRSATQSPLNFLESDGAGGLGYARALSRGAPEIRSASEQFSVIKSEAFATAGTACERDFLLQRQADSDPADRVRALYRENAQLLARLKALDSELEEARTGRDSEQQSAELRARTLERQLADCQSNVRQLNAERESLRQQLDDTGRELLQWTQERGAIERERDSLLAVRDDLQHRLSLAASKLSRLERETPWIESDSWPVESRLYEKKNGSRVEAKASADERASLESRIERLERELRTQTEARDELESRLRRHEAEAAAAADTLDALEEAKSERLERQRELRQVQRVQSAKEEWRKKKHKYSAAVRSARERAELAEGEGVRAGAQVEVLRKGVSHDEYNRVRKELRDLQRRLGDFRSVLMTSRAPEPGSASRELGIPGGKSPPRRRRLERSGRRTSNGRVEKPIR
uniref:Cnn_1N domain-containing protein n=1 Tax=Macrostomum lignano TaxID=282301 RepID=A0A1I8FCJ6_9PLAT